MSAVVDFSGVTVVRGRRPIVDAVDWQVGEADRWVVLGPNGAGKSTLLGLAGAQLHPTRGAAHVLGERLGATDVQELRTRIGHASSAVARRIPADETVLDAVLTAAYAVTGRWNEQYDASDIEQARGVLAEWQLEGLADRRFGTLSDGERKRTQIARAVMTDPELLLLDEPSASLDLGAREDLLASLTEYAASELAPAIVMVTHHVEEIPEGFTHALLLRDGKVTAKGPIDEVISEGPLSECFGVPLTVTRDGGRFAARAAR